MSDSACGQENPISFQSERKSGGKNKIKNVVVGSVISVPDGRQFIEAKGK